ncbi:MAG: sugar phosphate isomerase/epimerase, partial [Clostridiaceae bacterium]|nr:sugar phosphate isomerase/epimerase [Clostridiaceae bacterium]
TEEDRAERIEKMKKSIWGTSLLGCRCFVIHPIMPYGADKDPEPEKLLEMNYEFMSALLPTAKEHGVVICLENMPMTQLSLSRPTEILEFVKTINSEYMQVCIDTGHCAVFGESPADAVRLTGKYLKVLHVHDNNGKMDLHWLPYYGVIDWDDFNKALHEIGYDGWLSIETNVSRKLPSDIKEHHQIGLSLIAKKLAE